LYSYLSPASKPLGAVPGSTQILLPLLLNNEVQYREVEASARADQPHRG
jgi:hypothetical protein